MGVLPRRLQGGDVLGLPHSRPMKAIGERCHELRVVDEGASWRLVYRIDPDAVVIVEVFRKTTPATPLRIVSVCQRRLREYDAAADDRR